MSKFFVEKNEETARDLFNKRVLYYAFTDGLPSNLVDFNFAEKRLYGRVNRMYVPIVTNNYILTIESIREDISQLKNAAAINCVATAFSGLVGEFKKKGLKREIALSDEFLGAPKAYKAYEDPKRLYRAHLTPYLAAMGETIKERRLTYTNFASFINMVAPYVSATVAEYPFTLPAFIKSTHCPINVSGLAIEIADLDPTNDKDKWDKFYQSPNWDFYLNACAEYGFMVDRHVPWRIVADIASGPMLQYAAPYEIMDTDSFLTAGYEKAHREYFEIFKETLYQLYVANRRQHVTTSVVVQPDQTRTKVLIPQTYTRADLYRQYDDYYFLTLYCKVRFMEEESLFSEQEQDRIIDNILELAQSNFKRGLDVFERILNKPFDYVGSLSYISNKRRKLEE